VNAGIALEGVTRRFGDGTVAVRDLTLVVEGGELVVIVGPSGSGKSTVLRTVAGLEPLTAGRIRIGSRIVNDVPPRDRDVAMVFQNYALYPHMNVFDNMAFALQLRKLPDVEIRRRVDAAAGMLDIGDLLHRRPRELSGGQRQRVAMGRAIVRQPAAFLMDEPLSNLDARLRVQMRREIVALRRRLGTTTLYVTHDQTEAMTMGDRVAVMRAGVLQQMDRPRALYDRPRNVFVAGFIGSPAMNVVAARLASTDTDVIVAFRDHRISLPPATMARCPGVRSRVGREVLLGIRPEDVAEVGPGSDPTAGLSGTVVALEPHGADTLVDVEIAGGGQGSAPLVLSARMRPDSRARCGDTVRLVAAAERLHLFDPMTEEALAWPAPRP